MFTTRRTRVRQALQRLEEGSGSSYDIANKLMAMGITGRPHRSRDCPVARYLQKETAVDVRVSHFGVVWLQGWGRGQVNCPLNVSRFILMFDSGGHSQLNEGQPSLYSLLEE